MLIPVCRLANFVVKHGALAHCMGCYLYGDSNHSPKQRVYYHVEESGKMIKNYSRLVLPWKPKFLKRTQFEFAQWVTPGTSNILTPRFACSRTLTYYIGVSDISGLKSYPESYLLFSSAGLDTSRLLIGHSVIQLRAVIFSTACLVPPLELGHFRYSLPDPAAF